MIGWSISLGRIAGTELRLHVTFVLLILWFAISAGLRSGTGAAMDAIAFTLTIFACVLLHEYGHVLVARRYGIQTRNITLLPIGGVARIERMPERPSQELLVALAGPAVNLVIAVLLFVVFGANIDTEHGPTGVDYEKVDFVTRLALVNLGLALFNLIPAFPMDGGLVLRAILAFRLDRGRAKKIAAKIGQAVAFGLGFLGLFGNPILLFIALFVFLAATHETFAIELSEATRAASMAEATITRFDTLKGGSTVAQAVEKLLSSTQREFPVTDAMGQLRGVLTRDGIIKALAESGSETAVVDVMERDVATVNRRAPLSEAVATLQASARPLVGVVNDQNEVVGIVTLENIAEYLMVSHANRDRVRSKGVVT
jgi:stage IV sporulation protein FB